MVNKQITTFVVFYLKDEGLDKTFICKLCKKSLCSTLCHEVNDCTWDLETRVLTTKADTTEQEEGKRMEKDTWYKDKYGSHMQDKPKKNKKNMQHPRLSTTLMANIPSRHFMRGTTQDMLAPLLLR